MDWQTATHIFCYGYDDYTTNVSLEEALKPDVLLVHTFEGKPLPKEHGGPVRMITPQLYAWKGSKWINRIELMVGIRQAMGDRFAYLEIGSHLGGSLQVLIQDERCERIVSIDSRPPWFVAYTV